MKSIRTKIMVSMMLMVLIPLVIVGGLGVGLNYYSTILTVEKSMVEMADVAAERVHHELTAYMNVAMDSGAIARLANPEGTPESKKEIIDQRAASHNFRRGNIIGADGISIFDGKDYSDRLYFQQAIKGNNFISEPLVSKITGELSIMVAAPLWEGGIPDTNIVGVVYYVPEETFLNNIVSTINVSDNGMAFILNSKGTTIAHLDFDKVTNGENNIENAKTNTSLAPLAALNQKMIAGESGFGEYSSDGQDKYLAYAPIEGTDGWSIGISAPTSDFMRETTIGMVTTVIICILSCIAAIFISLSIANRIGNPISLCANRLNLLANGDVTSDVPVINNRDETGTLADSTKQIVTAMSSIITDMEYGLSEISSGNFNVSSKVPEAYVGDFSNLAKYMVNLMDRLSDTMSQVRVASEQVASGSDQVSGGAQALSQGATEQASSVQELAATINEISTHIKKTAENADFAREQTTTTEKEVDTCNEQMQALIQAMDEISTTSGEIGKIVKTIEDIAFQTNILALNAAVEAARAGAAGKGFAVVADEVRNLASKSAEASKNTSTLIEGALHSINRGAELAGHTAESLANVVEMTQKVSGTVDEITDAANEQANSVAQVTHGIDQISGVVQTNSATAEESAAASEELSGQAQMLKTLVDRFQLRDSDNDPMKSLFDMDSLGEERTLSSTSASPVSKSTSNTSKY